MHRDAIASFRWIAGHCADPRHSGGMQKVRNRAASAIPLFVNLRRDDRETHYVPFFTALGELRASVGMQIALLATAYAVLYHRNRHEDALRVWAKRLIATKPFRLVAVALANKLARIAFAIMRDNYNYGQATVG